MRSAAVRAAEKRLRSMHELWADAVAKRPHPLVRDMDLNRDLLAYFIALDAEDQAETTPPVQPEAKIEYRGTDPAIGYRRTASTGPVPVQPEAKTEEATPPTCYRCASCGHTFEGDPLPVGLMPVCNTCHSKARP